MRRLRCSHRPPCPGCPRFGEGGIPRDRDIALAHLAGRAGIDWTLTSAQPTEYRRRSRLMIRGRPNSPKVGIFQEGSHKIVDVPDCLVHHPAINRVAAAVKEAIRTHGIAPYHDTSHRGIVRAVQVVVTRPDDRLQVTLVLNCEDDEPGEILAETIARRLGDDLDALWLNRNTERTNRILGPDWTLFAGREYSPDISYREVIHQHPGAFGQANPEAFDLIVHRILEEIPEGANVTEMHCGSGTIGLNLLDRAQRVTMVEINRFSCSGLDRSLDAHDNGDRALVFKGAARDHLDTLNRADVVVVDPPRGGLEPVLLDRILASPPRKLVAVFCGFAAFMKTADTLLTGERARLTRLDAHAIFPQTDHVEILGVFESP